MLGDRDRTVNWPGYWEPRAGAGGLGALEGEGKSAGEVTRRAFQAGDSMTKRAYIGLQTRKLCCRRGEGLALRD